jgi:hypothetical protein
MQGIVGSGIWVRRLRSEAGETAGPVHGMLIRCLYDPNATLRCSPHCGQGLYCSGMMWLLPSLEETPHNHRTRLNVMCGRPPWRADTRRFSESLVFVAKRGIPGPQDSGMKPHTSLQFASRAPFTTRALSEPCDRPPAARLRHNPPACEVRPGVPRGPEQPRLRQRIRQPDMQCRFYRWVSIKAYIF